MNLHRLFRLLRPYLSLKRQHPPALKESSAPSTGTATTGLESLGVSLDYARKLSAMPTYTLACFKCGHIMDIHLTGSSIRITTRSQPGS